MYIPEEELKNIYLEDGNRPLCWHLPVGVLFDIHVVSCNLQDDSFSPQTLPWKININYKADKLPDSIVPFYTENAVESHFNQMCKEVCYLKYFSTEKIINLNVEKNHLLFKAVSEGKYDDYIKYANAFIRPVYPPPSLNLQSSSSSILQQSSTSLLSSSTDRRENTPRRCPIRIYFPSDSLKYIQQSIPWPDGEGLTFFFFLA
jgi:hypothetical protein